MIILFICLILCFVGIASGFSSMQYFNIVLGLNTFSHPTFEFGISSRIELIEDQQVQIFTLGLVVFIIEIEFFKRVDA